MFIRGLSAVLFVVTAFVQAEPQELSAKAPADHNHTSLRTAYVTGQANWEQPLTATNHPMTLHLQTSAWRSQIVQISLSIR